MLGKKETDGIPHSIKQGCGGFGVRNFLALLTIEVGKAIKARADADPSLPSLV